ncbi:MAG: 50S ribosomal protein L13 [Promethearchaeota archaeon]
MPVYIDGQNCILGRLASHVAKRLLEGETITICNAEKIIITGDPLKTTDEYAQRLGIRTRSNPLKGPFHPRTPEGLVRKTVRGMLPRRKTHGKEAYKRLKVYVGIPPKLTEQKVNLVVLSSTVGKNLRGRYIHIGDLLRRFGPDNKFWKVD